MWNWSGEGRYGSQEGRSGQEPEVRYQRPEL